MTKSKAVVILKDIRSEEIDPEDKLTAIQEVVGMETINSITKQELINVLAWIIEDYL